MERVSAGLQARGVEGLARAIALPHEHAPVRFPSFPALERTALLSYNYPGQWNVPTSDTTAGSIRSVLMRQPTYPLWVDFTLSSAQMYLSWAQSDPFAISPDEEFTQIPAAIAMSGIGSGTGPANWLTVTGQGTDPAIQYHLMGKDDGTGSAPWHYHAAGGQTAVYLRAPGGLNTTTGAPVLTYELWGSPGHVLATQDIQGITLSANFIYFNITFPIGNVANSNVWWRPVQYRHTGSQSSAPYYAQILVATTPNSLNGTVSGTNLTLAVNTLAGAVRMLPFARPIDFSVSDEPWNDTRLTAVSALFTNVTKVLNKEGTVLAGRIVPTSAKTPALAWNFTKETLAALNPAEKSYLALEHGHYTYCPPSTDMAQFWDYTLPMSGRANSSADSVAIGTVPLVRLDNASLVNCGIYTDPDGGTALAVNVDWHVEFRTTSQLWPLGLSTMTLESLHQAQLSLVAAGFFFPNNSHESEMRKIVSRLRGWAKNAEPLIAAVNPKAAAAMRAAEGLAQRVEKLESKPKKSEPQQPKPKREKQTKQSKGPAKKDMMVKPGNTKPTETPTLTGGRGRPRGR